jgi:hypothetical protein
MVRRLDIDLARTRRGTGVLAWLCLGAGLIVCAGVAVEHHRVGTEKQELDARIRSLARAGGPRPAMPDPAADPRLAARGIDASNRVIDRLAEPWAQMLAGVEAAAHEGVALLALEPDAGRRILRLGGEARDAAALAEYLARLAAIPGLTDVHLSQHEERDDRGIRVLRFGVTATWASGPS